LQDFDEGADSKKEGPASKKDTTVKGSTKKSVVKDKSIHKDEDIKAKDKEPVQVEVVKEAKVEIEEVPAESKKPKKKPAKVEEPVEKSSVKEEPKADHKVLTHNNEHAVGI